VRALAAPAVPAPASPARKPKDVPARQKGKARVQAKAPPPAAKDKDKDPPAVPSAPSAQDVETKFIAVKKEYGLFRKSYGARLDDEWNDILDVATYGRGDERYRKLSTKLDRFRQRMVEIKNGK